MPFTLAHPAAILPLRSVRYLRMAPLMVGAVVPDLPYYLPWGVARYMHFTHAFRHSFTIDLALGYALLASLVLLQRPLTALLSARARALCVRALVPFRRPIEWALAAPATSLPEGCALTLTLREPGAVRWGLDGWQDIREQSTSANSLGVHVLEIDTVRLRAGRHVDLTFRSGTRWVGRDFRVQVVPRTRQQG